MLIYPLYLSAAADRSGPQFLCGFARRKKYGAQSRQAAKASGSQTERTTISLRQPAAEGFARRKKNKSSAAADRLQSREGAKKGYFSFSVSLPAVGRPQFLCAHLGGQVSAPLRE
jgi:hypothetical protein